MWQAAKASVNGHPPTEITVQVATFTAQLAPASRDWKRLSKREQEVLRLLAAGFLKKEVAERLGLSLETVRTHCVHIYEKLRVNCRADAVAKVMPLAGYDGPKHARRPRSRGTPQSSTPARADKTPSRSIPRRGGWADDQVTAKLQ